MGLNHRYEYLGTREAKCPKCGHMIANVSLTYDNEGKLLDEFAGCKMCGAIIYSRDISDESEISPDITRAPDPCAKFETNPFKPTVKCPYCGSTSTKKISTLSRMGSFATFGFAGKKVGKQWHCNNCKSDF